MILNRKFSGKVFQVQKADVNPYFKVRGMSAALKREKLMAETR